jgi:ABC-type microcin C transport system duplicated ATPase subunit YejF
MAMLFITHDLGIVRRLANRVNVMQGQGCRARTGGRGFSNPQHPLHAACCSRRAPASRPSRKTTR